MKTDGSPAQRSSRSSRAPMRGVFERPKHSGVWWINYRDSDGQRHREKIGRYSVAEQAYLQRKIEIREGKFVAPRSGAGPTFRELATAALADKKARLALRSHNVDRNRSDKLLAEFGDLPAKQITAPRIETLLRALLMAGRQKSTVNRYRALLSSIFSFGVRTGLVRTNPVDRHRVPRFREPEHRIRFLNQHDKKEEERLRAAIRERYPIHEAELDLALNTGIRRGEQFALKWSDVDLDRGMLTVNGKTGRRFVEINSVARAAILALHKSSEDGGPFVCPGAKRDGQRDWRRWFEDSVVAAKIENFHWHDLRHTFASRLVMAGVDLPTVQQLLGHRNVLMTMRYAHLSPSHRVSAIEKLVEVNGK